MAHTCEHAWQVVVGVLGCPNLPQARISDNDGSSNSAGKAGSAGVGVIFTAERGHGAFAGPLAGACAVLSPSHVHHKAITWPHLPGVLFLSKPTNFQQRCCMLRRYRQHTHMQKLPAAQHTLECYTGRGDAAINMRFPHKGYREKIWDHAAGALIVQEAGAAISDASGASHSVGLFISCSYNTHMS